MNASPSRCSSGPQSSTGTREEPAWVSMSAMCACSTLVGSSTSSPSRSVESMSTPCSSSRPLTTWTSEISGTPRSRHGSSASTTATIALETRFLAPLTSMSPTSGRAAVDDEGGGHGPSQTQTPRDGDGWAVTAARRLCVIGALLLRRRPSWRAPSSRGRPSSPPPSPEPSWRRPSREPSWSAAFLAGGLRRRLLRRCGLGGSLLCRGLRGAAFAGRGLRRRRLRRRAFLAGAFVAAAFAGAALAGAFFAAAFAGAAFGAAPSSRAPWRPGPCSPRPWSRPSWWWRPCGPSRWWSRRPSWRLPWPAPSRRLPCAPRP